MNAQLVPDPTEDQIAAAHRGELTAELDVEWHIRRDDVPNFDDGCGGSEGKGTLIVQRDCDPEKIHLGTLVPDQRWAVSSYYLTEEQAMQLAAALLLAVKAGPWDDDEDEQ